MLTFAACNLSARFSDAEILDQFQRTPSQSMSFLLAFWLHRFFFQTLQSYQSQILLRNDHEICLSNAMSFGCCDDSMVFGNATGAVGLHQLCKILDQVLVEGGRAERALLRCSKLLRESSQEKPVRRCRGRFRLHALVFQKRLTCSLAIHVEAPRRLYRQKLRPMACCLSWPFDELVAWLVQGNMERLAIETPTSLAKVWFRSRVESFENPILSSDER